MDGHDGDDLNLRIGRGDDETCSKGESDEIDDDEGTGRSNDELSTASSGRSGFLVFEGGRRQHARASVHTGGIDLDFSDGNHAGRHGDANHEGVSTHGCAEIHAQRRYDQHPEQSRTTSGVGDLTWHRSDG